MKIPAAAAVLSLVAVALLFEKSPTLALAKKPTRARAAASRATNDHRRGNNGRPSGRAPVSRRRTFEEEEDELDDFEVDDDLDDEGVDDDLWEDEDDEPEERPRAAKGRRSKPSGGRRPPPDTRPASSKRRPSRRRYDEEEDEDEDDYYDRAARPGSRRPRDPPPRQGRSRRPPPRRSGSVVRYERGPEPGAAATFTRGLTAIRDAMPDPATVKDAAVASFNAARETTSSLSTNLYREVKGLTSSELEQVMLKATRPDDAPVKGKHVERLVSVTYQISAQYDIYESVLRKLWKKMTENDWRTTLKALYILHRFSADGAPDHRPSLKARLREMRRSRDPKRKEKYFSSKLITAGNAMDRDNAKFRAFLSRYAHYVLLRAQCFGGLFVEISEAPKPSDRKKVAKPITSTSLKAEHLEAAQMVLKAGLDCQLRKGEECENTAIACERVASDLIGLAAAVAIALNRVLKVDKLNGADPALLKKWVAFYKDELLPQTRSMVKKTAPKLDAYGLFLPSRMGTSVSPELLEKGLNLAGDAVNKTAASDGDEESSSAAAEEGPAAAETKPEAKEEATKRKSPELEPEKEAVDVASEPDDVEEAVEEGAEYDDEYEYDEEEYYDDEED